jgi:arsenite methyltransferase
MNEEHAIQADAGTHEQLVQDYYGRVLRSTQDLQTGACCLPAALPPHLRAILNEIHPEVTERFYGCGSPIPPGLAGSTVLDIGCGSGRDCFLLSRLVGPKGQVLGVDMTPEQIAIANRYRHYHAERFGYGESNVKFLEGRVTDLAGLGIADASVDVVVSNCVLNLVADKERAFAEIFRVLKPGGELYFSDVYADRRIPSALRLDPVLLGECLAGALYLEDFRRLIAQTGCLDPRVCASNPIALDAGAIERTIGMVLFSSVTWRIFKLPLEDRCEDFGQIASYLGTLPEHPHHFDLDDHHHFEAHKPLRVCGNTADMLSLTRYAEHFQVLGDKQRHFGLFDCAPIATQTLQTGGACC